MNEAYEVVSENMQNSSWVLEDLNMDTVRRNVVNIKQNLAVGGQVNTKKCYFYVCKIVVEYFLIHIYCYWTAYWWTERKSRGYHWEAFEDRRSDKEAAIGRVDKYARQGDEERRRSTRKAR